MIMLVCVCYHKRDIVTPNREPLSVPQKSAENLLKITSKIRTVP